MQTEQATKPRPQDQSFAHPIEKLIWIMACLRDKDYGCPWDLEQDFASIAPYTIEEAYEVADAIERADMKDLREELGDLLLQPIYHAQMASEDDHFTIEDVIEDVCEKMITRHPHVFGDQDAQSAEDVNAIWDARKKAEKSDTETSVMDSVTKGLPALLRAQKLQKKAAKTGFEWSTGKQVLTKLHEEITELQEAVENGEPGNIEEEFGDVLQVLTNFARIHDIHAEDALRKANSKFERRFRALEAQYDLNSMTLDDMIEGWKAVKDRA